MLTGKRALVAAHQFTGFQRNRPHLRRALQAHVKDRSHMQSADRRVGVPGAARSVLVKHLGQLRGVLG